MVSLFISPVSICFCMQFEMPNLIRRVICLVTIFFVWYMYFLIGLTVASFWRQNVGIFKCLKKLRPKHMDVLLLVSMPAQCFLLRSTKLDGNVSWAKSLGFNARHLRSSYNSARRPRPTQIVAFFAQMPIHFYQRYGRIAYCADTNAMFSATVHKSWR